MNDVITFLNSNTWQANTVIAIAFLLATTVVVVFLTAFFQGRAVSFWLPKIGARPQSDNSAMSRRASIAKDIRITKPRSEQKVPWRFAVEGLFSNLPEGYELWIFTTDGSGLSCRYWPQDRVVTREDGTWKSQVYGIGGDPGAIRTFGIFLVGQDGQVLIEYWKAAGKKYVAAGDPWLPLTRLTQDIQKCHEVDVVVESGRPQPAT